MAIANETSHSHIMQITISQVSELESIYTSEVFVHGVPVPWKVKIFKNEGDDENESCLAIRLICASKDKSKKWSISGAVSCKLLPFSDDVDALEGHLKSDVFDYKRLNGIGFLECIQWDDLFDGTNKYVKDDTIKLEIKIDAENPNNPNRSGVQLESINRSCDGGCSTIYRLTIANFLNLMAVRTPPFWLRGLSWNITVGKDNSSNNLFVFLDFDESTKEISCNVTWSIKLVSSKADIDPINHTQTEQVMSADYLIMDNIVSWSELIKPENGYVDDNSIVLEVEIKSAKSRGDVPKDMPNAKRAKTDPNNETILPQMECALCSESINGQELGVTPCGHLFCLACIKKAVAKRAICPTCNKAFQSRALRQLFLPFIN